MAIVVGFAEQPESRVALDRAAVEADLRRGQLGIVETMRQFPGDQPSQVKFSRQRIGRLSESGTAIESRSRQQEVDAHYELLEAHPDSPARQLLASAEGLSAPDHNRTTSSIFGQ